MKTFLTALRITAVSILLCGLLYPLLVLGFAQLAPAHGLPVAVTNRQGKTIGYQQIGQPFTELKYFHGRPSAVGYNGAGSGGSNKGPTNPGYLKEVSARALAFRQTNNLPAGQAIPADVVTASGSGLDPHISAEAARLQAPRILRYRPQLTPNQVNECIALATEKSLLNGQVMVNVLKLNSSIDQLTNR